MDIERARKKLFEKDETNGYIDREAALDRFLSQEVPDAQPEKYVSALEYVLGALGCPVDEDDLVVGRMNEGPIPYEMEPVPGNGFSHVGNPFIPFNRCAGHMSLYYTDLVKKGLSGIVEEMKACADLPRKKQYAAWARRSAEAIKAFAARYANAAREAGLQEAAEALLHVPYEGAYDFFSAVQSVWLMEMILSCVTGGRDFAYSRLDLALQPFYDSADEAHELEILESFLLLNNSIGGMNSDLEKQMPVPCSAGNIYLMLGGRGAEEALPLSLLFLKAAEAVRLPQPVLALRISENSVASWKDRAAELTEKLSGQVSFYNDDALIPNLKKLGFPAAEALNYTMSGCNRAEFCGHMSSDNFHNVPQSLLNAFYDPEVKDMEGLYQAFRREMDRDMEDALGNYIFDPETEPRFFLESLLLAGCPESVTDVENGGQRVQSMVHHLCGFATAANSLAAIDKAVFKDRIMTLDEFRALVKGNFEANPLLGQTIRSRYPKYGNDDPAADAYAAKVCEIIAGAAADMSKKTDRVHIPGLYSLWFHNHMGIKTGATPDGRLAGEPLSENQSPVYGTDREGITALLNSAGSLPQSLFGSAGFNVRLEKKIGAKLVRGLTEAYFSMGGINLCIDVVSRDTLLDAMQHPDQYPTLCVRIVGYSEIFVRLPLYMQQEIVNRTGVGA